MEELLNTDTNEIHENCIEDFRLISEAIATKNK